MNVNKAYFVEYARRTQPPGAAVLDFGCGSGETVELLREAGFDARGVDVRWPGADYGELEGETLSYYEPGEPLPYPDDTFDLVVSDHVFEHVPDLEAAMREINRVLKPGGRSYHHFPTSAVWREGHIGIPFAHRLPPGRGRLAYATALRKAGLGIFKDDRPAREWAAEKLAWVDDWTEYRSPREIRRILGTGAALRHGEIEYCRFRAGDRRPLRALLDRPRLRRPAEALFRRIGFDAIEAQPMTERNTPNASA